MKPAPNIVYRSGLLLFMLLFCGCFSDQDPLGSEVFNGNLAVSSPEAQGLDSERLSQMESRIEAGDYGEIHSVIIIRNDHLVLEKYFRGYQRDDLHYVYSVTKSVTSALIGIAISQGHISGTATLMLDFFPEYEAFENDVPEKHLITLEHLLTMSAGFRWDEWSTEYGHPQNDVTMLANSGDWILHMLELPMAHDPGTDFTYNSGCSVLLSGIIENRTGQTTAAFADKQLFQPLGIDTWGWDSGPHELTNTGWGLHLRPIDMALFGYVFLNQGRWEGEQVVPAGWVQASTAVHIDAGSQNDYGYQWWRFAEGSSVANALATNDLFFAWGYGGQFIFVIPHLDMVVVSTADNFDNGTRAFNFLRDYILASVQ